ncbi:hypothetical protein [Arsenicicoccus dermatophilus]|uniref:hypothetical protein n=1 Tax=Arsenicicoccus dermatophilus TaxID=1076331 RepID=UPI002409F716|nr:hypothetical protein [Arsenicicoccus dermatophilus]
MGQVSAISVPAPDPAFVARLADRLRAEAIAPAAGPHHGPSVVRVPRAWPKALAGAAAGVIVATTGLGVASEHALPGDLLYGVRGVVDGLEVQLAGSDGDQGRTLLAQARRHIGDTETLSGRPEPEVDAVREALRGAAASVESGDAKLFLAFDSTRDPSHLVVVRDFTSWSEPALRQLRRRLPAAVSGELASLESAVESGATELRAKLAACGDACKDIVVQRAPETASTPSATSPAVTPTIPASPSTAPPVTSTASSRPLPTPVIPPVVLPTTEPPAGPIPPWRTVPGQVPTAPPPVTVPATRVPHPPRPPATATATVPPPAPPTTTAAPEPTDPGPRPTATTTAGPTVVPPTPSPTHTHHCPPGYVRIGPYCIRMPQGPEQLTVTVVPLPPVPETTPTTGPTAPAPVTPAPEPTAPAPSPPAPSPPKPTASVPVSPSPTATSTPVLPSPASTGSPAPEPAPTGVPAPPASSAPAPEPEAPEPTAPPTTTAPPAQPAPGLPSATSTATDPAPTGRPRPTGHPEPVEPVAPVFADRCLPGPRIVTLPKVHGLVYSWDRATLGGVVEVTVRARPLPGHVLADGATSTWGRLYLDCGRP